MRSFPGGRHFGFLASGPYPAEGALRETFWLVAERESLVLERLGHGVCFVESWPRTLRSPRDVARAPPCAIRPGTSAS
jgi:hypothetical protein